MRDILRLLRIHHSLKNLLVLLPVFFGGQLLHGGVLLDALTGFACFCCMASAVYVFNDRMDAERDRQHPSKRGRPIAAGRVSKKTALALAICLMAAGFGLHFLHFGLGNWGWVFLLLYLLINLAYSLGLKHMPIVDVAILAAGFLLRLVYGAAITGIEISSWLYLTVMSIAFFLSLGKRRNELKRHSGETRPVLKAYTQGFLDKCMYLMLSLGLVFYSLWTVDPITVARLSHDTIFWTVPLVVVICMRYSLIIEGSSDADPVEVVLHDRMLLVLLALFVAVTGYFVYL